MSQSSLLSGNIAKGMLSFAFPLMLGNLLQQCYNLADTFIVGRFIGAGALAAVGAAYALMVFLNSVQFGLCLGSSALFSIHFGSGNTKSSAATSSWRSCSSPESPPYLMWPFSFSSTR